MKSQTLTRGLFACILLLTSLSAKADSHDVFGTFYTKDKGIYDPGKDKTYASRMKKLENGTLEVKGCISFFCLTQIWVPE